MNILKKQSMSMADSFLQKVLSLSTLLLIIIAPSLISQDEADTTMATILAMSLEELLDTKVTIATKSSQKLNEAPSVVSIITADDIKNMGAREFEDILQTIPGFELSRSFGGYYTIGVRGVRDPRIFSKILIMMDGVPFNQIFYGNYVNWGYVIDLDAIERIEIIRGPGSALYGRNAFSAVINFITKKGDNNEKFMVKSSLGSYNLKAISAYYGFSKNKINASVAINKTYTDIADSKYDDGSGNLARWNLSCNNLWINTNISLGDLSLSGIFIDLNNGAVINESVTYNKIGNYSLEYNKQINSKLHINARFSGHNTTYEEFIEEIKPGVDTFFTEGLYHNPSFKEYMYGFESETSYKISQNNDILIGLQGDLHGVTDVKIKSNMDYSTFSPIPGIGKDNLVEYGPSWFENKEHHYTNFAFFLQDIWYPVDKIGFTAGGRIDVDSEIGIVFNPRAGIIYKPINEGSIKLLYGRAYRAPAPADQYVTFGYAIGNKDLKPEIMNTYEIVMGYNIGPMINTISLYRNKLTDMIYAAQLVSIDPSNKYYNIGKNISSGIEFENKCYIGKNFYSYLNYSYTKSVNTDKTDNTEIEYNHADVAPHKLNTGINYLFLHHFKINVNMFYRSKMEKFLTLATGEEVKDDIGNYAIFNSTFQIDNLIKNFNFSFSVYNMLDKKYYSQDSQHAYQPAQPGRQYIGTITYTLK